jgi:hypothetical protein
MKAPSFLPILRDYCAIQYHVRMHVDSSRSRILNIFMGDGTAIVVVALAMRNQLGEKPKSSTIFSGVSLEYRQGCDTK